MEQWIGPKLGKEYVKGVYCHLANNLHAEYIMRNAWLDEAQAGIKIAGRNINNPRYADDTSLMAESEEELKSLLMKVKEESEKFGLKLNLLAPYSSTLAWKIPWTEEPDRLQSIGPLRVGHDWATSLTFRKLRSWHLVPSLHGKSMGNNGNSVRLYFGGLQNHCRQWLQPWN